MLPPGHEASGDPLWLRGVGGTWAKLQPPSATARLPRRGASPQVHLRCKELKLIPQQAGMKRRQKSRMLVNAGSGWSQPLPARLRIQQAQPSVSGTRQLFRRRCVRRPRWEPFSRRSNQPCRLTKPLAGKRLSPCSYLLTGIWVLLFLYFFFFLCCPSCWGSKIKKKKKKAGQTSSNGVFSAAPLASTASLPSSPGRGSTAVFMG